MRRRWPGHTQEKARSVRTEQLTMRAIDASIGGARAPPLARPFAVSSSSSGVCVAYSLVVSVSSPPHSLGLPKPLLSRGCSRRSYPGPVAETLKGSGCAWSNSRLYTSPSSQPSAEWRK